MLLALDFLTVFSKLDQLFTAVRERDMKFTDFKYLEEAEGVIPVKLWVNKKTKKKPPLSHTC